jgi:6,7-dimethyl-8-ribityllumazine synthase
VNREFLESQGFQNIDTYWVPGAFEIPGFTAKLLETEVYDLIIALGVVIRGDTPHFDYVCGESARGIMDLTISYDTPIVFGILTCNTEEQVISRIGSHFAIAGLNLLAEVAKIPE